MVTDKLLHRIRAHLASPGITKAGLAKSAGLHPNTLRDADREDWNPTTATLRAIEPLLPPELGTEWPIDDSRGEAESHGPFS